MWPHSDSFTKPPHNQSSQNPSTGGGGVHEVTVSDSYEQLMAVLEEGESLFFRDVNARKLHTYMCQSHTHACRGNTKSVQWTLIWGWYSLSNNINLLCTTIFWAMSLSLILCLSTTCWQDLQGANLLVSKEYPDVPCASPPSISPWAIVLCV